MPIASPIGFLDVVNATLRASQVETTSRLTVANTAATKNFSVGDRFHIDKDSVDPVSVTGNVVASGIKISNLTISPTFDLAAVSNVGNTTSNTLQFANATTSFVASSNVEIGGNITLTSNAQVKVGSNVLAEYTGPHGREPKEMPLKKFPEINFRSENVRRISTSNTYIQAGYEAIASSHVGESDILGHEVWRLFDGSPAVPNVTAVQQVGEGWMSKSPTYTSATGLPTSNSPTRFTGDQGSWVEIVMPKKIQLHKFSIKPGIDFAIPSAPHMARFPKILAIHAYDGSSWTRLGEFTTQQLTDGDFSNQSFDITSPTSYYNKFVLVVKQTWSPTGLTNGSTDVTMFDDWELYGKEESAPPGDLSLDTTLKSTFNSVRSNNYVMYFDGDGFIPGNNTSNNLVENSNKSVIHHNATYDTTEKYWTLDGSTESNVTTGSLGFEGDVPHTVSTWINASNLDANATTQQLFSIGSGYSEEIVRVDDTQIAANTWHNVTYAYQGLGGSKVTYVDGRKVTEENVMDTFAAYPTGDSTELGGGPALKGFKEEIGSGGYKTHASSTFNGYRVWRIFDNNNPTGTGNEGAGAGWASDISVSRPGYTQTGVLASVQRNPTHHTGSVQGEWVSIEMPHNLVLSSIDIESRAESTYAVSGFNYTGFPKNVYLYGSKDNSTWTLLKNFTTVSQHQGNKHNEVINLTESYNHFALVINSVWATTGGVAIHWASIGQLRFYGHKEGDLTRFPEPTRVLKYPHIAMTGPGQRGYVATASSNYSTSSNPAWYGFTEDNANKWASLASTYSTSGAFLQSSNRNLGTMNGGSGTVNGEWLMIEMPHKLKLQSTTIISPDNGNEVPDKFIIYGSNDLTGAWSIVDNTYETTEANIGTGASGKTWTVSTASGSNSYRYFGFVTTNTNGGGGLVAIDNWELYGTQEDTGTPAIVGGPFAGKVANFRVYDQYLGDERIQEIYDAQKDEFGHKKSSMTFYKGRVGVGTTEPEGALTVMDEPNTLEKFPARGLEANDSYVEGQGYFKISNSVRGGDSNTGIADASGNNEYMRSPRPGDNGYLAFSEDNSNDTSILVNTQFPRGWSTGNARSGNDNGPINSEFLKRKRFVSAPGYNTRLADNVDFGAWLKIETPESILLKKASIEASTEWEKVGNDLRGEVSHARMGEAVGVNGDGTRIAISSAQWDASGSVSLPYGKVEVYEYDGFGWVLLGNAITSTASDYRGSSGVALNDAGNILIIGSPLNDDGGSNAGKVEIFQLIESGSTGTRSWTAMGQSFTGSAANDQFGDSVAISTDGYLIAFGASGVSNGGTADTGAVYVYEMDKDASPALWVQRGSTMYGDAASGFIGGQGNNLDMSPDGKYIIAGGRFPVSTNGKVMIWEWNGSSAYVQKGSTINGTGSDRLGSSTAISNDGNTLAIGESLNDEMGVDSGAIHIYTWNSGSSDYVRFQTLHQPSAGDDQADDRLHNLAMSGDGKRLVVGAFRYPGADEAAQGRLYTYEYDGVTWKRRDPYEFYGMIGEPDFHQSSGIQVEASLSAGGSKDVYGNQNIAITRDGSTVVYGMRATTPQSDTSLVKSGLVQVFQITSNIKGIWGSNDDRNWTKIVGSKTFRWDDMIEYNNLSNSTSYKYHAIIGDAYTKLKHVNLYGIQNKGQSTLHDGELILTKNLKVPRIGGSHTIDKTPRRDELLVEYDTSTNPMISSRVRDTSGNEHHGHFIGGLYDSDAKCLTMNVGETRLGGNATGRLDGGTVERIMSRIIHSGGRPNLTASIWINPKAIDAGSNAIFQLGNNGSQNSIGYRIDRRSSDGLFRHRLFVWGGMAMYRNSQVRCHEWMHVVVVHHARRAQQTSPDLGCWDLYVDGEFISSGGDGGGGGTAGGNSNLNLSPNPILCIGAQITAATEDVTASTAFHGSLSNFKLYNCALDAQDAKTLYEMGRLNEGSDTVSMSRTRVGVGIGDGQVPTTGLDVRSGLRIPTQLTESGGYFTGKMRFNTSTQKLQIHNGRMWLNFGNNSASGGNSVYTLAPSNRGGTLRFDMEGGRKYQIHAFTSSGTFTANGDLSDVDVLIVAGGGGGGTDNAGGGGAGGLILRPSLQIANGTHSIVVGTGGSGAPAGSGGQTVAAGQGNNSSAFGLTAIGGGRGLNGDSTPTEDNDGGSGGGADAERSSTTRGEAEQRSQSGESGQYGHGNHGGARNNGGGGGGGGAGEPGMVGSGLTSGVGGQGGNGLFQVVDPPNYPGIWNFADMFGTAYGHAADGEYWFAGGGGGGNQNDVTNDVAGGLGGGGAGRGSDSNSSNATDTQGGGGGGATYNGATTDRKGGDGGNGIVLIRYPL